VAENRERGSNFRPRGIMPTIGVQMMDRAFLENLNKLTGFLSI